MNENFKTPELPVTIRERIKEKIKNSKAGKYLRMMLLLMALGGAASSVEAQDNEPTVKVLVKGGTMIDKETGEERPMIIDAKIQGGRLKTQEEIDAEGNKPIGLSSDDPSVMIPEQKDEVEAQNNEPTVKVLVEGGTMIDKETGEERPMIIDAKIQGGRLKTQEEIDAEGNKPIGLSSDDPSVMIPEQK